MTSLSTRDSRIRRDVTCLAPPICSIPGCSPAARTSTIRRALGRLIAIDDCPDVLSSQRPREVTGYQTVDDLDFGRVTCALHELEHCPLDHEVAQIHFGQLANTKPGGEARIWVLLRIRSIEPILVFDIGHRARAPCFRDEIAAGVGAMRRDAPNLSSPLPEVVGDHAWKDHGMALSEIVRQSTELFKVDERNSVTRQQVVNDARVLSGDRRTKHGQHACWETEVQPETVHMAG